MKKLVLATALSGLFMASAAQAATTGVAGGQVNFYGQVTDVSCTVSVDGQGSDASVYVAPISIAEITAGGADTLLKGKPFNIDVSNCTPAAAEGETKTIGVTWVGGNLLTGSTKGYLANSAATNGAAGIQFGLSTTANGTVLVPGDSTQAKASPTTVTGATGVSRFTYYVGYVTSAPASVTAGQVESYATYQITYQ